MSLSIIRGTSKDYYIRLKTSSGDVPTIPSSAVIIFGVKKRVNDTEYAIVKTVKGSTSSSGVYTIHLDPADTLELDWGIYYYDIGLKNGTSFVMIKSMSEFTIEPNITKMSDAVVS